jgi:dephospho-CoA kinase
MEIIGITGGIGSGKSVVARIFRAMNRPVYDCDSRAKAVMTECAELRSKLSEALGCEVYNADGTVNKPFLASFLFASEENVSLVNSIVHPFVKKDFLDWVQKHNTFNKVYMECAILYESGFDSLVDKVIAVTAPEYLRYERVMRRDGIASEQVRQRVEKQMDDKEKCEKADFIIHNDEHNSVIKQILAIS